MEGVRGLSVTTNRIQSLRADFKGMENLDKIVDKVVRRLAARDAAQGRAALVKSGAMTLADFDGWFAELVRVELGKTLGILRNKAVQKARNAGAGSASSAVLRRMYRSGMEGNINIAGGNKRLSSRTRVVPPPNGGESGIRRTGRTVKDRTKKIREYFGPDRGFILRILESGRDVFKATADGATGPHSGATWGKRGAIAPRPWFFHSMKSDMELAAQRLGQTLTTAVENWVEQEFNE